MPSKRVLRVYKIIHINTYAKVISFDSPLFALLRGGRGRAISKQKKRRSYFFNA